MFARRTEWDLRPNRLSQKLAELRSRGEEIIDLTESNPTRVGLNYPPDLLQRLAQPQALLYEPDPKGLLPARQAVAALFAGKGARVDPKRILLAASTSEAYTMLFRLLADPGEQILIPRPSYPLFDYLAGLNDLETVAYSLRLEENGWRVDLEALKERMTARTRALILVHPNNPTGSCVTAGEHARLLDLCAKRGVALIADEVFTEYLYSQNAALPATLLSDRGGLVFALGGLSKWMGLPQMKLAWIACAGPEKKVDEALERLEVIADTALSVNTPVQLAFPSWAASAAPVQDQIRRRIRQNRDWLKTHLPAGIRLLPADGGWNAVLEVPAIEDEEEWVLQLLEKQRVFLHPGYFFDFERPGILVVSLLPAPDRLQEGVRRVTIKA